ncbi:O-methyltransferase [Metabacillus malikii]|uniref:tRNA 5-hydroxyuridine methyltransferase n=1 Tax=Metabacillus malikii TaxID=1504265 RepID=A0ABT9ZJZ2_9BACI|nr:O-methyltransferase [Metabacillus malikii]MDQ0231545.1 putative O-methyltransferase YrrM [Metabacillus malikii]
MIDNDVITYLENLLPKRPKYVQDMEEIAAQNEIPIMEKTGIEVLLLLLSMQRPKKILEIGTAIGYSAIRMALKIPTVEIYTIELDEERYQQANQHIKAMDLETRIHTFHADALEISEQLKQFGPFDALFIDATKAKYTKFFQAYEPMLSDGGIIYSDNVLFKGTVARDRSELQTRRQRTLVRKLNDFNKSLYELPNYDTTIIPVGDGIAVTKRT